MAEGFCATCANYSQRRGMCLEWWRHVGPGDSCARYISAGGGIVPVSWSQQNDAAFRASQSIRERILELHRAGKTSAEISQELGISRHRVAGHIGAAASVRARQAQRVDASEPEKPAKAEGEKAPVGQQEKAAAKQSASIATTGRPVPKGIRTEDVAAAILRGESWSQVAQRYGVSDATVSYHVRKARQLGLLKRKEPRGAKPDTVKLAPPTPADEARARVSDALVITLRLPMEVREIVKLMKAIKEALPDREWTVEGAYTEMRLIGRRLGEEAKAA